MNFYASPEYLAAVAEVYFKGQRTSIEDVRIGDEVLRLLVIGGKRVVTNSQFLDYHEPLGEAEIGTPAREHGYVRAVVRGAVDQAEWETGRFQDFEPAPYVDWSMFPTWDDYKKFIKNRQKGHVQGFERKRRRLVENLGSISFCADDRKEDVLELARRWKSRQLRETGAKDYFADPKTGALLELFREKGVLTSSTLRAEGRLLAVVIGFVYDGVWTNWVVTYDHDPEIRKYSPGHQLLHSILEESHRLKHRQYDFSIGGEEYKWIYTTHARLVGPIGRTPMQQRIFERARHEAKRILSQSPRLHEMARSLKRALRN